MRATTRSVLPWSLYGVLVAMMGIALWLTDVNDSFGAFVALAIVMMFGYGTVGALLASRDRAGVLGWLMLTLALGFVLTGITDEVLTYGYVTNPDASVPFLDFAAWLTNWLFIFVSTPLLLLPLLYPTGRVQSSRWRLVPRAVIVSSAIGALATIVRPGLVDTDQARIMNPTGVEALRWLTTPVLFIGGIALLVLAVVSVVSLFLRFRSASGDERQQIRWLAYLAVLAILLLAGAVISGFATGGSALNDAFFLALFAVVGIAFPVAIGFAILKYRLYDLDLVIKKTVLYATVAILLTAAFFVVASLVGGRVIEADPQTVVALLILGFAVWPAVRLARRVADRIVYGRRATPYEVLSEFSHRVGGSYAAEDVLPRMAAILAEAMGASLAVVWLRIGREWRPVGIAPVEAEAPLPVRTVGDRMPTLPADAAVEVRDQGELLGALTVSMPANDPMGQTKERLIRDLASQAGLVLRNVRLIEELRASRQRLVAAQDEERRRLERNIHDGAQQQLVALTVKLRLLEQIAGRDPAKVPEMAAQLQAETTETLEDLRDLARGIYPPLLADKGLSAALEAQARKSALPVTVEETEVGRFPQDVEAAIYFSCLEALQNVAKYAAASRVTISLARSDGRLSFAVADDGVGFDLGTSTYGTGLQGIADRMDALDGTFEVISAIGAGTTVRGSIPVTTLQPATLEPGGKDQAALLAAAHASSSRSGPKADLGI
jgi:signal transduction histidine kinase